MLSTLQLAEGRGKIGGKGAATASATTRRNSQHKVVEGENRADLHQPSADTSCRGVFSARIRDVYRTLSSSQTPATLSSLFLVGISLTK